MQPFSNEAGTNSCQKVTGLTEWGPMNGDGDAVHRALSDDEVHGALCDDEVHEALCDELGRLSGSATFTVAELAAGTASIFEISRDEHGTPIAVRWRYACEDGAPQVEGEDRWSGAIADPEKFYRCVAPRFIVRTPERLPSGPSDLLSGRRPEVPVYTCEASLPELLRAAVRELSLIHI